MTPEMTPEMMTTTVLNDPNIPLEEIDPRATMVPKPTFDQECHNRRDAAFQKINQVKFTVFLVLGVLGLVLAMAIKQPMARLSLGVIGFFCIIYGTLLQWSQLNDLYRLLLSAGGLLLLGGAVWWQSRSTQ